MMSTQPRIKKSLHNWEPKPEPCPFSPVCENLHEKIQIIIEKTKIDYNKSPTPSQLHNYLHLKYENLHRKIEKTIKNLGEHRQTIMNVYQCYLYKKNDEDNMSVKHLQGEANEFGVCRSRWIEEAELIQVFQEKISEALTYIAESKDNPFDNSEILKVLKHDNRNLNKLHKQLSTVIAVFDRWYLPIRNAAFYNQGKLLPIPTPRLENKN